MRDMDKWLDSQRPHATEAFVMGADLFSRMLKETELVDVPLDELVLGVQAPRRFDKGGGYVHAGVPDLRCEVAPDLAEASGCAARVED